MDLLSKINNRSAKIGIIGLGYVGIPIVLRFCEEGFKVIGFDIDSDKITQLNRGESYIKHISSQDIKKFISSSLFEATSDMTRLSEPDAIIICVPTPLTDKREPDMQYVENTAKEVAKHLRSGQIVSLESTTYPGTTDEVLLPLFEEKGLKVGVDYYLVFSPEREDPGRINFTTKSTPKVVGGVTSKCSDLGVALYSKIVDKVIRVSSTKVAEMTKLLENIYRCVNIALVNELKMLLDRMGIDLWEVIEAAQTKPFGFQPFFPGPGLGGHCIPIDPFYLTWKAREFDFSTRFIELAGEINSHMPYYVMHKLMDALSLDGKALRGSKILILGIAYKKDVDDMRESPALKIIKLLKDGGAEVEYNDPYVPVLSPSRHYSFDMKSVDLTEDRLKNYDTIVIVTDHTSYDYEWIARVSKRIVDTRNTIKKVNERVTKA